MTATRATQALQKAKIDFELLTYAYDPNASDIGMQAAEALGVDPAGLLKTLMVETSDGVVIALVPSDRQMDLKALAKAAGAKKCAMLAKPEAERLSGYVIGGISPLGQKKRLPVFIDASVEGFERVILNGGGRGVQVRLSPQDLAKACSGRFVPLT
ncbi:MAG: Cys-tRNA(Pro) deacylase [Rhodospirillaceae bacterium]